MMKKLSLILLVFIVLLSSCTPNEPTVSNPNPNTNPVAGKADIGDKRLLHQFVKSEITDISWDQFAQWEMLYCDITGDGSDDVVLVSPNVEWHNRVEIISADGGQFVRINSDIPLAKYSTEAAYEDGFLVMRGSTGGPGENLAFMDLYAFNNSEMQNVLDRLLIEHTVSFPTADYEERAEIQGEWSLAFIYTLTRHDNLTNKTSVVKKERYRYVPLTQSFLVQQLTIADDSEKLYLHQLSNGDSVGRGLIIEDIDFKKGSNTAKFILSGTLELEGMVIWDDYFWGLMFSVDDKEPLPVFVVEGSFDTIEYSPRFLRFRNVEDVHGLFSAETLEEIKTGQPYDTVIKLTDIRAVIRIGSESDVTCEFVGMGK